MKDYKKCECFSEPDDCDFLGSTCSHTDCFVKDLLKQLHSQQKTFTVEDIEQKVKARIKYIQNKLSGCCGYSTNEKAIRCEELAFFLSEFKKEGE